MRKKKLIFDMDGTLLDSMGMWHSFSNKISDFQNKIPLMDPIEIIPGTTVEYSTKYLKSFLSVDVNEGQLAAFIDQYLATFYTNPNLHKNNVVNVLQKLKNLGYTLYIATATDIKYARIALESNNLIKYFEKIFTPDTLNVQKHDIVYFEKILSELDVSSDDVVFFDDVLYAVKLSKSINIKTIGVYDEYADNVDKIKEICDHFIYDFEEIIKKEMW